MKHLCVVLTEPSEGKQAEFDQYDESVHLDEVLLPPVGKQRNGSC